MDNFELVREGVLRFEQSLTTPGVLEATFPSLAQHGHLELTLVSFAAGHPEAQQLDGRLVRVHIEVMDTEPQIDRDPLPTEGADLPAPQAPVYDERHLEKARLFFRKQPLNVPMLVGYKLKSLTGFREWYEAPHRKQAQLFEKHAPAWGLTLQEIVAGAVAAGLTLG